MKYFSFNVFIVYYITIHYNTLLTIYSNAVLFSILLS